MSNDEILDFLYSKGVVFGTLRITDRIIRTQNGERVVCGTYPAWGEHLQRFIDHVNRSKGIFYIYNGERVHSCEFTGFGDYVRGYESRTFADIRTKKLIKISSNIFNKKMDDNFSNKW